MIEEPDRWAPEYAEAGAESVTFHVEAAGAPIRLARELHRLGARAAMALKPATPIDPYADLLPELDMVSIMTVEPGFGGQKFLDLCLPKITRTRRLLDQVGGDIWLQIDGGVSAQTIERCAEAGVDSFVAGPRSSGPTTPTRWSPTFVIWPPLTRRCRPTPEPRHHRADTAQHEITGAGTGPNIASRPISEDARTSAEVRCRRARRTRADRRRRGRLSQAPAERDPVDQCLAGSPAEERPHRVGRVTEQRDPPTDEAGQPGRLEEFAEDPCLVRAITSPTSSASRRTARAEPAARRERRRVRSRSSWWRRRRSGRSRRSRRGRSRRPVDGPGCLARRRSDRART